MGLQRTRQSIGLNRCPAPSEFSLDANIRRGQQAGGDVISEKSANTADLFEIIRTTRAMRRLKPDPERLVAQQGKRMVSGDGDVSVKKL